MLARTRHLSKGLFYGWVIVAVIFIIELIVYGIRYSFSVFYLSILNEFGWSRASTAGIFSLNIIVYGLMAPVSGRLSDRFGPRKIVPLGTILITLGMGLCSTASKVWHFYLLFGVIFAVGSCIAGWSQFAPILAAWFIKRRGIAFGVGMAGFGLCFLLSPLAKFLIVHLSWRGAFIVLGALPTLIIAPLTICFVERKPEDVGLRPDGASVITHSQIERDRNECGADKDSPAGWTFAKAIRTYRFWLIFFANFCALGIGQNLMVAHQVAFIHDIGYSEVFAASLVGVYGVLYAVGNLFGFVSDRLGAKVTFTFGSAGILTAMVLLVTISDAKSLWQLYTYIVLFGFCTGLSILAFNAIIANIFQGRSFGAINGFLMLGFGIGGSLGPWIGGYVFDIMGTYVPAFFIVIIAFVIACIFVWMAAPKKNQKITP